MLFRSHREQQHLQRQLREAPNDKARQQLRERLRSLDWELSHLRRSLGLAELQSPRY